MYTRIRIAASANEEDADGIDSVEARALGGLLALEPARAALPADIVPEIWPRRRFEAALDALLAVVDAEGDGVFPEVAEDVRREVAEVRALLARRGLDFVAFRGIEPWYEPSAWETEEWLLHECAAPGLALWSDGAAAARAFRDAGPRAALRAGLEGEDLLLVHLPSPGAWLLRVSDDEPDPEGDPPVASRVGPLPLRLPRGRLRIAEPASLPGGPPGDEAVRIPAGRFLVDLYLLEGAPFWPGGPPEDPHRPDVVVRLRPVDEDSEVPVVPGPPRLAGPPST